MDVPLGAHVLELVVEVLTLLSYRMPSGAVTRRILERSYEKVVSCKESGDLKKTKLSTHFTAGLMPWCFRISKQASARDPWMPPAVARLSIVTC